MRNENFLADLHDFALTVLPIMTEFGMVTAGGKKYIFKGQSHPSPDGAGPSVPKKLGLQLVLVNMLIKSIFNLQGSVATRLRIKV